MFLIFLIWCLKIELIKLKDYLRAWRVTCHAGKARPSHVPSSEQQPQPYKVTTWEQQNPWTVQRCTPT